MSHLRLVLKQHQITNRWPGSPTGRCDTSPGTPAGLARIALCVPLAVGDFDHVVSAADLCGSEPGHPHAVPAGRVVEKLAPLRGPPRAGLEYADLPLEPVPARERLEEMIEGPGYIASNARQMLEALDKGESLRSEYSAPLAVWQFGNNLSLVTLPGEVVNRYVPLLETALGSRKLWIAAYSNDYFGYLPTARSWPKVATRRAACTPSPGSSRPKSRARSSPRFAT